MFAALPVGAVAEIVYTHGQTAPPSTGTWVPSTLVAMSDTGASPQTLVTPAQAPSTQQAVCCSSLSPNSSTALFEGFDYQFSGNAAGGFGDYYEGIYELSGGTATRLSPTSAAAPGQSSYDAPAVLTANGQVIFQHQTTLYAGSPPSADGQNWSMDEGSLGGGAANPWLWVGDNGVNAYPGANPSFPPSTFASDPADPSLVAYSLNGQLYTDDQGNTDAVDVAAQPSAYANGGLAWSPDGTELVDVDNTSASSVGTPGADGYSPGLWIFSASASGAHHLLIASPGAGDLFSSPVFVGQNEIAFTEDNNIWEVSASCNACSFPGSAKQLTTDGASSVQDYDPSWTSRTITAIGGTGGTLRSTLGKPSHSGTTVSIAIKCSSGTGSCDDAVGLATEETLRGSKVVAVAARKTTHKDVVLGSKAVAVAQGSSKTVSVSLNRAGKNLLKKFHRLPVLLIVLEGTTTVGTDKVTLVGP